MSNANLTIILGAVLALGALFSPTVYALSAEVFSPLVGQ
jgi:hypothetical protein